jgi:hypothetical protein
MAFGLRKSLLLISNNISTKWRGKRGLFPLVVHISEDNVKVYILWSVDRMMSVLLRSKSHVRLV